MTIPVNESESSTRTCCDNSMLTKLSCAWDVFQDIGRVLKYTRLSLIVTMLAGAALFFVDQGQDLLLIHAEEPRKYPAFYPAIVFWAVNAWYWARFILTHGAVIPWKETCNKPYFGGRLKRVKWLIGNVPRYIGAGAFVWIALAQVKAAFQNGVGSEEAVWLFIFSGLSLALAITFYTLTKIRRRFSRALGFRLPKTANWKSVQGWFMVSEEPEYDQTKCIWDLPVSIKNYLIFLVIVLVVLFIVVLFNAAALKTLGPDVILLVGASLWIAPGTFLLFISKRGDVPLLTILVCVALFFSLFNDNHGLRQSVGHPAANNEKRKSIETAFNIWRDSGSDRANNRDTLVIVATAGGGSRAAYWTGNILGAMQDLLPNFDKHLFGISGVSGGSLGAIVYRGLLTALPNVDTSCQADEMASYRYWSCARKILKQDFLSPTLAAMLFPELVQKILPAGILPDRAKALEESWEAAWREAIGPGEYQGLFEKDFLNLWKDGADLPALFLNGTSVATGKRIVTSNLKLAASLPDTYDFFHQWPIYIPMSTAANNSARFPIIGPAGTLPSGSDTGEIDRIVDGGYFENFGATTALDVLQVIESSFCDESQTDNCSYDLIVIQISSDPDYGGTEPIRELAQIKDHANPEKQISHPGSFAAELLSPLVTLLNTRSARGVLAAQKLRDWTENRQGENNHFIEFRLNISSKESNPPLGWILSESSAVTIDCQLAEEPNRKNFEMLAGIFEHDSSDFLKNLDDKC